MTITADQLRDLMALGIEGEKLLAVVKIFERDDRHDASRRVTTDGRSKEADRAARYREKRKQTQSETAKPGVALATGTPVTDDRDERDDRHDASRFAVTIAPLSKKVLPIKEGEEKEEEEEKKESKEVAPSKLPRARGTRLPDDWVPSEIDIDFALKRGHSRAVISIEGLKFRNYWTNRTDKQATKRSWHRAWQNWILNIRPVKQENNVIAAADDLVDTMRQWEKTNESIEDLRSGEGPSNVWVLPAHRRG